MPIASAVARVRPAIADWAPRRMLPPPLTTATWTPSARAAATSSASAPTPSGSTGRVPPRENASPETLSRMRRKRVGPDTATGAPGTPGHSG